MFLVFGVGCLWSVDALCISSRHIVTVFESDLGNMKSGTYKEGQCQWGQVKRSIGIERKKEKKISLNE
jgi:hypothetical protein